MFKGLTRRDFIKTMSLGALAMALPVDVFAAGTTADLVVYGKIFTSEDNRIVEAFAVKDGRFVYVGDKLGAATFIKPGKTEVIDYTGKGLVMPSCEVWLCRRAATVTLIIQCTAFKPSERLLTGKTA